VVGAKGISGGYDIAGMDRWRWRASA
jgi:hypothetical protein